MPRYHSAVFTFLAAVSGLALLTATTATAQTPQTASPAVDGKPLVLAAATANGAPGDDAKPWHIKISYTQNSPDGKAVTQGTFEEFWAAPSKYKRIFASPAFSQVEYGTPAGPRRAGARDEAPADVLRIVNEFLHPIEVTAAALDAAKVEVRPLAIGSTKLVCVTVALPASGTQSASSTSYCTEENTPVLRLTVGNGGLSRTSHNSVVKFQEHYLPQSIEQRTGAAGDPNQKPACTAKIDALETLSAVDDAMFVAPADAVAPPKVITLDEKTTKKQLLQHPMAEYPETAHYAHVGGVVVIALRVQTDGHVTNLRVVSGNPMLQQAALDAIKKWTYKPFLVDGQPVEVDTTASTTFNLMP